MYARDIYYFEASGKLAIAHYAQSTEEFSHMLADLEKVLESSTVFFRIHRSYIINMMYVKSYDAKTVTLMNGVTLPLKAKGFQEAYRDFMFTD